MRIARFTCFGLPIFFAALCISSATYGDDAAVAEKEPATAAAEETKAADDAAKKAESAEPASATAETEKTGQADKAKPSDSEKNGHDAKDADKTKSTAKKKRITIGRIVLKNDYPEGTSPEGIFGELQPRLQDVLERLDKAAKDDSLAGVLLELRSPEIGLGKVNELRAAIARVRKSGKKVYADVQMGLNKDYLIACACDEVVMPESGILMITGLRAEVAFFKKLFDKLDIRAEFIQVGDFKGASEPFTRSKMSPEFRKQLESVIEDYYQQMIETIATDRKLDRSKVKELIDLGMFTPARAKEAGLIDRVSYEDELAEQLKKDHGAETLVVDRNYGRKQVDADFSGFAGFMKLMDAIMGNEPGKKVARGQKIAIVYAVGPIMTGESKSGVFGNETLGSDTIVKAIRTAEKDEKVKAIVLRVDSPGGSALGSDLIWREITRAKKPVVASMGDVAGSGGYYISMGADKIFAEPGTLTGSIGVVTGKLALKGFLSKIGITTDVISRGEVSGSLSPIEPLTEKEREAWLRVSKDIYAQFTTKASQGRKMDPAKLETVAQGKLFSGRMAAQNGLVDKVGTLEDAIAEAKSMAGLKPDEKVDLLILPKPKSFFEQLFENQSLDSRAAAVVPELAAGLQYAQTLRELFRHPAVTIMPYQVEFK